MADTIRVTKSNIIVLETDAPAGDGFLRATQVALVLITGITDESPSVPPGRSAVIFT